MEGRIVWVVLCLSKARLYDPEAHSRLFITSCGAANSSVTLQLAGHTAISGVFLVIAPSRIVAALGAIKNSWASDVASVNAGRT